MTNPTTARSQSSQVRVVVRIRPFLPSETDEPGNASLTPCVTVVGTDDHSSPSCGEVTVHMKDQYSSRNECYKLDSFYGQDDDLSQIFHREVSTVIPGIMQGFNATVFAYGATGSGKTYTMQGTDEHPGLVPLALSTILSSSESSGCSVEMSYYEVYMDRCYDLLEPKAKEIMVLEDKDGQVQLKGLSRLPVQSMAEFNEAFSCGVQRRKVAHTGLNDVSSRSHGVLSVHVTNGSVTGKLNLIDLAGNEDNRRTCNEGIRLQESAKINQSLFALSNVIYALNNNEARVPYRESKLTRILQDSLGGNSRALMIACLNPGSYPEAVHTVSLAARSRHIVNYVGSGPKLETPKVKMDMEAKLRAWLESKGKTKSMTRINNSRSPFLGKTSNSMSCRKRSDMIKSSANSMVNDQGSVSRKLFDSAVPITNSVDGKFLPNMAARGDNSSNVACTKAISLYQDTCCGGAYYDHKSDVNEDYSCAPKEESSRKYTRVQLADIQPKDTDSGEKENFSLNADLSSNTNNLHTPSKIAESSPFSERVKEVDRSLRKALSPVNSNMTPVKHFTSDGLRLVLLEQNSPKTQSASTPEVSGTPLDKFNALSSNLKDSLAKQYLEFLNVASKELVTKELNIYTN